MRIPSAFSGSAAVPAMVSLGLGAVGGVLFDFLGLPLAWMIGAMCFTTVAALAGAPLRGPERLREVMVAVLGLMLGSTFTPEVLERAGQWVISLTSLVLCVAVVAVSIGVVLHRRAGFGPVTALFSATPGGLVVMVLTGGALGGDERTISLMHSMRLLLTVLVIPFWFQLFHGYQPSGGAAAGAEGHITALDAGILGLCAVLGYWGAKRARIPAHSLIGPMILSALVHVGGLTAARPPAEVVAVAQVVIGTAIGCRFAGVPVRRILGVLVTGGATTLFMMGAALVCALALERATGLPFQALVLAFAPGGLAEMSLISLSMGIDTAFVATHHIVRILFLVACAPIAFRLLARWLGVGKPDSESPPRQDRG